MEEQRVNLEGLLVQLYSKEGRAFLISKLVGKVDVPSDYIIEAIEVYERAGRFRHAAGIAKRAGMVERANRLYVKAVKDYEKAGRFREAAKLSEEGGMVERARLYRTIEGLVKR